MASSGPVRVTKRRPWWSDGRRAAAAACSLLWLAVAEAAPAAPHKANRSERKAPRPALPAQEFGTADILDETPGLHGQASFYGHGFQGRKTSTGERFDIRQFTAASNRFPLGSWVAVRRVDNDRCAIVKVNDRMHPKHRRRIIDVSLGVAEYLGMIRAGVVFVRVAPIKGRGGGRNGSAGCHAAFEAEQVCVDCGQSEKLPEIEHEFDR